MMCDHNTCGVVEYIENDVLRDIFPPSEEFITSLQHEKCKVIQLVREQIQRFNDTQYDVATIKTDVFGSNERELESGRQKENVSLEELASHYTKFSTLPSSSSRKWITNIVDRARHRINLILAALVIGVVVWMSLVYGALLGASLCNGSRSCFPFTPFKYTHAKHSLF